MKVTEKSIAGCPEILSSLHAFSNFCKESDNEEGKWGFV